MFKVKQNLNVKMNYYNELKIDNIENLIYDATP